MKFLLSTTLMLVMLSDGATDTRVKEEGRYDAAFQKEGGSDAAAEEKRGSDAAVEAIQKIVSDARSKMSPARQLHEQVESLLEKVHQIA